MADSTATPLLKIGDTCHITENWNATITAYTVRSSGKVEYQLEWVGNGELKSDWLTVSRMKHIGIRVYRDGKEVEL